MTRGKPGGCHEYGFQHQAGGGTGCHADRSARERGGSIRQSRPNCRARQSVTAADAQRRARVDADVAERSLSNQVVIDRAAASIVYQVVETRTSLVVKQFPEEAVLRRRAYFRALDLTRDAPTRLLATDRKA